MITFAEGETRRLDVALIPIYMPPQQDRLLIFNNGLYDERMFKFKTLRDEVSYAYHKEYKSGGALSAAKRYLNNPNTKYYLGNGHGDHLKLYWGEYEVSVSASSFEPIMSGRPPITFGYQESCDSMQKTTYGSWAYVLTKNLSPYSCMVGHVNLTSLPVSETKQMWDAVKAFFNYLLQGYSFYGAYQKGIADYTNGGYNPSWNFKFAGDTSPDFKLPYTDPMAGAIGCSLVDVIADATSVTYEINVTQLGHPWVGMFWECNSKNPPPYCSRYDSAIIDSPGTYLLTLTGLKKATAYYGKITLVNSYQEWYESGHRLMFTTTS